MVDLRLRDAEREGYGRTPVDRSTCTTTRTWYFTSATKCIGTTTATTVVATSTTSIGSGIGTISTTGATLTTETTSETGVIGCASFLHRIFHPHRHHHLNIQIHQ
jgi:hypothetical protein